MLADRKTCSRLSVSMDAEPTGTEGWLRDLSTRRFWYPQGSWNQSPEDTERMTVLQPTLFQESNPHYSKTAYVWLETK